MEQAFEAGIFVIDKPAGPTSFKMVSGVRRALGIKKVGHAGTLDPFATGLLIICAGRPATRMISQMMDGRKEYLATLCLGVVTETFDPEGAVVSRHPVAPLPAEQIEECLSLFRGEQLQVPPIYSALKHQGKPLYHYARQGISIVKAPRPVFIETLERTDGDHDMVGGEEVQLSVRVVCSKGTYIRSLAADIGRSLGCGAYLTQLRRTRSGCFTLEDSFPGSELLFPDARQRLLAKALSVDDFANLL
ncbi:MAG: tRNA pseudouridine(55) synthase TruB [Proteobacteria bacterium]|nr:tRNA pseudouridine(55) synthase TruB [Pseudomonadota bacterium]MBU1648760.1 tRNA pseudouridine(55) synthase TruB [Pseudomonadota bacterium]